MEQDEFARRIEVYLKLDAPNLSDVRAIAEALSRRLFQYIHQPPPPAPGGTSAALRTLLPNDALLMFTAVWDGQSQAYRPTVREAAARLGRQFIELDVDDTVGGAIATAYRILNTPAVATGLPAHGRVLLGIRTASDLLSALSE